ncbi:hypothetical protein YPPY01_3572, partial [Yersinia pestis PY-01]
MAPSAFSP